MTSVVRATPGGVELTETERYLTMMYQKLLGRVDRGEPRPTLQIQRSAPRGGAIDLLSLQDAMPRSVRAEDMATRLRRVHARNSEFSSRARQLRMQQNARLGGMRAWIAAGAKDGSAISRSRPMRRDTSKGPVTHDITFRVEPVVKKVALTPTFCAKNVIAEELVSMRAELAAAGIGEEFGEEALSAWRSSGLGDVLAKRVANKIKQMQRSGQLKKVEERIVMHA